MHNGDVFSVNDKLMPVDTLLGQDGVYADDIYDDDVYTQTSSDVGTNIPVIMRSGMQDGMINGMKFESYAFVMMENTDSSQTMTLKRSNEVLDNFDAGVSIDTALPRKEAHRGGSFIRRNYQLEYSGDEQIFCEGMGIDVESGD